jgi:hypothetical protein
MVPLAALWLPILLSAVIVFVASSIMHMALKYHQSSYKQLPEEGKILDVLREAKLAPALYTFPYTTHKDMKTPEVQERFKRGPVGMLTMYPSGPVNISKFMGMWFVFCLVVGVLVAYLAAHTVGVCAPYRHVFRVVGMAAFLGYGVGPLVNSIWKGQPWSMTMKEVVDGVVYGLLTAGTFGWLWPH